MIAALASHTVGRDGVTVERPGRARPLRSSWKLVDPDGHHDAEQRTWLALLPARGSPIATVEELCARLEEVVQALAPSAPRIPPRVVAAVMAFLGAHPDRRPDDEVVVEALREAFPSDVLPEDVATWLAERR